MLFLDCLPINGIKMLKSILLLVFVGISLVNTNTDLCPQDCLCRKTFWRCTGESVIGWPLDNIPHHVIRGVRMLDLSGTAVNVLPNWPPTHNFPDLELILLYNTVYDGHQCRELECLQNLNVKVLAPRCTPEMRTNCPHPTCCHWEKAVPTYFPPSSTLNQLATPSRDGMHSTRAMAPTGESGKQDTNESPPTGFYEGGSTDKSNSVTFNDVDSTVSADVTIELDDVYDLSSSGSVASDPGIEIMKSTVDTSLISDLTGALGNFTTVTFNKVEPVFAVVFTEENTVHDLSSPESTELYARTEKMDSTGATSIAADLIVPVTDRSMLAESSHGSSAVFTVDDVSLLITTDPVGAVIELNEDDVPFAISYTNLGTDYFVSTNVTELYPSGSYSENTESFSVVFENTAEISVLNKTVKANHIDVTQGSMESDDFSEFGATGWSGNDSHPFTSSPEMVVLNLPVNYTIEDVIHLETSTNLTRIHEISDLSRDNRLNDVNNVWEIASVFNPLISESEPMMTNRTDTNLSSESDRNLLIDGRLLNPNDSDIVFADTALTENGTLSTNASLGNDVRLGLSMDTKAVIGTLLGIGVLLSIGLVICIIQRRRATSARETLESQIQPTAPEDKGMENANYAGPDSRATSDTCGFSPVGGRIPKGERLAETRYNRIWGDIRQSISRASSYFSFPGSLRNTSPETGPSVDTEMQDLRGGRGHPESSRMADDDSYHTASGPGQESGSSGGFGDYARQLDDRTQYFVGRWGGRRLSDPEFIRGMAAYSASTVYDTLARDDKGAELVADGIRDFRQVSRETRLTGQFQQTREQQLDQRDIQDERRRKMNKHVPYYGV